MNRINCEAAIKWIIVFVLFVFLGGGSDPLSVLTRLWMTLIEIGLIGVIYLFSQFRTRLKEKDLYV